MDLTTQRPDGEHWDLSREEDVEMLETLQEKERPILLIVRHAQTLARYCTSRRPRRRLNREKKKQGDHIYGWPPRLIGDC